jgi:hypothetical protein
LTAWYWASTNGNIDGEELMQKLRIEMLDGTWVEVPESQIGQFFAENAGKFKYDPIYTDGLPRKKAKAKQPAAS